MNIKISLGLILSALLVAPVPAQALPAVDGCKLRIDPSLSNWIIDGYEAFSSGEATGTYDLTFINDGDGECRFLPIFELDGESLGLQTGSGGASLSYSLLDQYGGYNATPVGGRTLRTPSLRRVEIAPHSQQLVRYVLNVATDALDGDGLYRQKVVVKAEMDDEQTLATRNLTLGLRVLPSATLGFAGAFRRRDGQVDIDLGELQSGLTPIPLQLYVQSTRGYNLEFKSLNSGKLRLGSTDWTVSYRFIVDGNDMDLSSDGNFTKTAAHHIRRDSLPVGFYIGSVDNKRAGSYSDLITITASVR